jgi:hypothetical protein
MAEDAEKLRRENARLQAALRIERAGAIVSRLNLPPSSVQILAAAEPEEMEQKAQQIARELAQRVGVPAGPPAPVNQEHGDPARVEAGGDSDPPGAGPSRVSGPEEEFPEPENIGALSAVTRSGPEGASPADPGPVTEKDVRTQAIRQSENWDELEQAMKSRGG